MKKFLKIFGISLVVLLALLVVTPFLFQGKIKELVQKEIDNQLNARVYFGDVSLSFIRSFPDARITLEDLGVVGIDLFERDTLLKASEFALVTDIMTIIRGEDIVLKKVLIEDPVINVIVLQDGTPNYDIVKPGPEDLDDLTGDDTAGEKPADSLASAFKINLEAYSLRNASIRYYDETFPMTMEMTGVDHEGKGNFTDVQYNLITSTEAQSLSVLYDGITYLTKAKATAEAELKINTEKDYHFELLDNVLTVNDMKLTLDGDFTMREFDYLMDLTYKAPETSFKSLLSLVPGVYTADFQDVKAEGSMEFSGFVKGVYSDSVLPGFGLNLKVPDARVQYPDLPTPITGIKIDLSVQNPDGDPEKTEVDVRAFHADLGANPIDVQGQLRGMEHMTVKGNIKARLNLEELTQIFPIEGSTLKGLFVVDAEADGVYDEAAGLFPKVKALMDLSNGYVRNAEYPTQLSDLFVKATLTDETGSMANARFQAPEFRFLLDGEPIRGSAFVENFDDPFYKIKASGKLDLEKLLQIYPVEGMDLKGKLTLEEFSTQGRYSDIEAERYDKLPTSGKVNIQNLVYKDVELAAPITVDQASARFTPSRLEISQASGKLGASDYAISGYFSNYLAYALMEDEPLKGEISLKSRRLNLNEWMTEESPEPQKTGAKEVKAPAASTETATPAEQGTGSVIPVPANFDVILNAELTEVLYEKMKINNLRGKMSVAEEVLTMNEVSFDLLGGKIAMNGLYNTQNVRRPLYSFFLDVRQIGIRDAFNTFRFVRAYVPIAETVTGMLNTQLGISGLLHQDMTPVLESIDGSGLFEILSGGIANSQVLKLMAERTKIKELSDLKLNDIAGQFEMQDGFLRVKPFDISYKNMVMTVGGRQNIAGFLDYTINLDVPSGMLGQAAYSAISNLTGGAVQPAERIKLNLRLGGTVKEPKLTGGEGGTGSEVKGQLTKAAEDELQNRLGVDVSLNKDTLKAAAQNAAQQAKDTLKQAAQAAKQQAVDNLKAKGQELGNDLRQQAGEEVKKAVGEDAKKALDDLKNRFGVPKKKGGG